MYTDADVTEWDILFMQTGVDCRGGKFPKRSAKSTLGFSRDVVATETVYSFRAWPQCQAAKIARTSSLKKFVPYKVAIQREHRTLALRCSIVSLAERHRNQLAKISMSTSPRSLLNVHGDVLVSSYRSSDRLGGASPSGTCHPSTDGYLPESTEAQWQRRQARPLTSVQAIKARETYIRAWMCANLSQEAEQQRPLTPDPCARCITKRGWEAALKRWRHGLADFVAVNAVPWSCDEPGTAADAESSTSTAFRDACLIDALRCHGFPILAHRHGPFWVLRDGNAFLSPWNHRLTPASWATRSPGRYILASQHHFSAVSVDVRGQSCVLSWDEMPQFLDRSNIALRREASLFRILPGSLRQVGERHHREYAAATP